MNRRPVGPTCVVCHEACARVATVDGEEKRLHPRCEAALVEVMREGAEGRAKTATSPRDGA